MRKNRLFRIFLDFLSFLTGIWNWRQIVVISSCLRCWNTDSPTFSKSLKWNLWRRCFHSHLIRRTQVSSAIYVILAGKTKLRVFPPMYTPQTLMMVSACHSWWPTQQILDGSIPLRLVPTSRRISEMWWRSIWYGITLQISNLVTAFPCLLSSSSSPGTFRMKLTLSLLKDTLWQRKTKNEKNIEAEGEGRIIFEMVEAYKVSRSWTIARVLSSNKKKVFHVS